MHLSYRSRRRGIFYSIFAGGMALTLQGCGGGSGSEQPQISFDPLKADQGYGVQGVATIPLGVPEGSNKPLAALQRDGKLLVVGYRQTAPLPTGAPSGRRASEVFARRLNSNGSLDASFGVDGEAKFTVKGSDRPADIQVQSSGRILIAVSASEPCSISFVAPENYCVNESGELAARSAAIVALTPTGAIDRTFGTQGVAESRPSDSLPSLALQTDQRVLLLRSHIYNRGLVFSRSLSRFSADGIADASFEQPDSGKPPCEATGDAIVILGSGTAFSAGSHPVAYGNPVAHPGLCLAMHNGENGRQTSGSWTSFAANYALISLHAGHHDRLSAVGTACTGTRCDLTISRYNANGSRDTTYGSDGIARFSKPFEIASSFVQADGSIVIFGQKTPSGSTATAASAAWMYIDPTGSPAKDFGVQGILISPPSTFLPVNALKDAQGRWLLLSSHHDAAGNLVFAVKRTSGKS